MYQSDVCVITSISHPASFIISRRGNMDADIQFYAWNTKCRIRIGESLSALRWSNASAVRRVRLTVRRSKIPTVLGRGTWRWSVSSFGRKYRSPLVLFAMWQHQPLVYSMTAHFLRSSASPRILERWSSISRLAPEDKMARNYSKLLAVPSNSKWERWGRNLWF